MWIPLQIYIFIGLIIIAIELIALGVLKILDWLDL